MALASRTGNLNSSEIIAPTTPASSSHSRLGRAPTPHLISGLACGHGMVPGKNNGGLVGVLGPPPKEERGRKKIKAENGSSLLVVPYPILASGNDQSCAAITAKPGKTYRWAGSLSRSRCHPVVFCWYLISWYFISLSYLEFIRRRNHDIKWSWHF